MPTVSVNLDTTQYVKVNTGFNPMMLQALNDTVYITLSDEKPTKSNSVFHILGGKDAPLHLNSIDTNVWALAITNDSSLIVSEIDPAKITNENNFYLDIAKGDVAGHSTGTIFGRNTDIDPAAEELVWDYGGRETYLTADTELFLSSDNAGDTNISIFVWGMTDDFVFKQSVVSFTSGQLQQSIGVFYRIFRLVVVAGGVEPLGNIYCAEADTLTLGVPDTATKVHSFMAVGTNITHKSAGTVPAGHTMHVTRMFMGVRRGEDAVVQFRQKPIGYPAFVEASSFPLYQSSEFLVFDPPFVINEKTDFELTATTVTNNTQVVLNLAYILVDNSVVG